MNDATPPPIRFRTGIGDSDVDTIRLLGHDLSHDLIGKLSFGELAYWLITKRRPTGGQAALFEAVLVTLADHGFTPTAIAARVTFHSAPESLQGAVAAGLLGGGSRYLGVTEDAAMFLAAALADATADGAPLPADDTAWDALATKVLTDTRAAARFVPGLGHPVHKQGDPRTPVLIELARQHEVYGQHLSLYEAIGRAAPTVLGRALPLNGAGVCGAVLADIGIPPEVARGVALLARCAGLIGHLAEEQHDPVGGDIYRIVDGNTDYRPPT